MAQTWNPPVIATTTADDIKFENCSFSNTYPITIRDGRLVHDECTAALFRAGYQVVPVEQQTREFEATPPRT